MKHINYFDLGLGPHPYELEYMVKDILPLFQNITYNIYGIEAHPKYTEYAKTLFKDYKNIHFYNLAISNKTGIEKLYLQDGKENGDLGNSIFKTKNNVNKNKFYEVESSTFYSFLLKNNINLENSINILKVNIEGAELYLWENFKEYNLTNKFQILCGYHSHDICKVSELKDYTDYYFNLIKELNINLSHFCHYGGKEKSIKNMIQKINNLLQ